MGDRNWRSGGQAPEGSPCSPAQVPVNGWLQGILLLILIKMHHRCWGFGWHEDIFFGFLSPLVNFHEEREKVGMMGLKKKEDDWCSVRGGCGNVFVIRAYSESTYLLVPLPISHTQM